MHIYTSVVADFSKIFLDFSGFGFVTCYILGVGTKRWPFKKGGKFLRKQYIGDGSHGVEILNSSLLSFR